MYNVIRSEGPFINYVTLRGGGGGPMYTLSIHLYGIMCDGRVGEGGGSIMVKNSVT